MMKPGHLTPMNEVSTDNARVNAGVQETTFRSAKGGVKGISRRNDADFDCTE